MARLTINGQPVELRMDADVPLLWGLREGMNLTGAKYGCGEGACGACTVIVDGQATRSCVMPLGEAEGRTVETIEALARTNPGATPNPVIAAFVAEQAVQCGFCTPGMVMATTALLRRNADPSEAEIAAALDNLCRCGVYPRLVATVQRAAAAMRGGAAAFVPPPAPGKPAANAPATATPAPAPTPLSAVEALDAQN